jgi:hypothetical protein
MRDNLSSQHEAIYQEARKCAERAMSLEDRIAAQHGATYFQQQQPEGLSLQEVVGIFKQAFEEKRLEEEELDEE